MVLKNVFIAMGYFLGAVAGDFAAVSPHGSSPIWPAAGVALAALYLYGNKVLPGILLGALSGQFYSLEDTSSLEKVADSIWMGAIVGTGSTVQAWFGNWLLKINRMTSSDPLIDDEKILRFFFYGAFLGTTVSPTVGTTTLLIKGVIVPANSLFTWTTWWVGDCMGVLVFAPVMLALFEKPRYYWQQRAHAILLSNFVVIGLTFILFSYSKNWDRAQITERFNHGVTEFHHQLMAHLNDITVDNTIMKAFFDNSKVVQREEFYAFAAALSLRHPYMQALEWIPRVDRVSRKLFEKNVSDTFTIQDIDSEKRLMPAAAREEYFPILFAYPLDRNESVIGFDITNNKNAVSLIEQIKISGRSMFSSPIKLVQDRHKNDKNFGYVVYSPVYQGAGSKELSGVVAHVFRLTEMVDSVMPKAEADSLYLSITDGGNTVYRNYSESLPFGIANYDLKLSFSIPVANKNFNVTYFPSAGFFNAQQSWRAWLILLGGFLFAGLNGIGLMMLTGRTLHTEHLVRQRTSELDSAKRKLEKQNMALFESLTKANEGIRAKDNFLTSMSHELRTPLNAVLGFAQLLEMNEKNNLSEEQKSWIGYILSSGQHLLNLISDILDFAGLSSGKLSISMQRVELSGLTEACMQSLQSAIDAKKIAVETELFRCHVMADETRLKQVLLNLLTNAVKYNRENGRVGVRLVLADNNKVRLSIEDSGIGIPESRRREVFQPFNRMGRETTHSEGTGIGLVISKTLVERMSGTIGFDSEEGKGSTFWVEFERV